MSYLNHLTLITGACRRSPRSEVSDAMQATMLAWLQDALASGERHYPMPGGFEGYTATVLSSHGALIVTVWGKAPQVGNPLALATFGVAHRSRHAAKLWEAMIQPGAGTVAPGTVQPSTPYLAVHVYPAAVTDRDALRWLADFERSVAWAWIPPQQPRADLQVVRDVWPV